MRCDVKRNNGRAGMVASLALSAAFFVGATSALVLPGFVLTGCKKKVVATPPPPPPPPPPAPKPVEIDGVMQSMKADARVQFPQEKAPVSEELAKAVISFADALAKGDSGKMEPMLNATAKGVLAELRASGGWDEATAKIQAVRVVQLSGSEAGGALSLAVQEPGSAYVLNWAITGADGKFVFQGMPGSSQVLARASDWDTANVMPSSTAPTALKIDPTAIEPGKEGKRPDGGAGPEEKERDRRKVNTPGGPVTVPGGG